MLLKSIKAKLKEHKLLAILIDPENFPKKDLEYVSDLANKHRVDLILVGGSLVSAGLDDTICRIKDLCDIPVIIFPGSLMQISEKADGILLISLISGRNPENLIGNHVAAAPVIKKFGLEVLSTGYILTGNANETSVGYLSNSMAIPEHKTDIAVATAMAGEMIGHKMIYLEGGSGAEKAVSEKMIRDVKGSISIPLIVGGGINNAKKAEEAYRAGADIIVVGNAIEKRPDLIAELAKVRDKE